ncbi:MAG: alpha/beta fold hydrolase [Solirubrobacteraceae bacterium]
MRKHRRSEGYRRGPLRKVLPSPAWMAGRRAGRRADEEYGSSAEPSWREVDWSSHLHHAQVAGRRVRYVDLGEREAQAVVFVHGLGGCWQNWLENMPAVALDHRVVALDLPGFGGSEMPSEPVAITRFAEAVESLCDHLGLGPVAVVGNSMGGFTAAELAIRQPGRVERLVLVAAAGISVAQLTRTSIRLGRLALAAGGAKPEHLRRLLRRPGYLQFVFGLVMRHPTRLKRDLLLEQVNGVGKPGFGAALEALLSYDFRDRLGEIACPTLVVQGTEDVLVPLGDAREFERRIPRATSLILEDTGHVPMLERPITFNRAVLEFLEQDVSPAEPDPQEEPVLAEGRERGL